MAALWEVDRGEERMILGSYDRPAERCVGSESTSREASLSGSRVNNIGGQQEECFGESEFCFEH